MRNSKVKRLILALAVFLTVFAVCLNTAAAEKQKATVMFSATALCKEPAASKDVIAVLARGAEVTTLAYTQGYYFVNYGDLQGYIMADNLRLKGLNEPVEGQGTVNADDVNVRFKPTLNESIVTVLKKGTSVTLCSMVDDWFEVDTGKYKGYVQADYLDIEQSQLKRAAYTTLRMGMTGQNVVRLQEALKLLGYEVGIVKKGCFGALTREAVKAYQTHNGLKADGVASCEMQRLLYSELLSENG